MLTNILYDWLYESIDLFTHLFMFDTFLTRRWSKARSSLIVFGLYLVLIMYMDIFYFEYRNEMFINYVTIISFILYKNKILHIVGYNILIRLSCLAVETLVITATIPLINDSVLLENNRLSSSLFVLTRVTIVLPLFLLIRKLKRGCTFKDMIEKLSLKQTLAYSFLFLLFVFLSYSSVWKTEKSQLISDYPMLGVFSFAVLGFVFMSCNCIEKIVRIKIREDQVTILSKQIGYQDEQAKLLMRAEKGTKKIRHDMKSKLITALYNVQFGDLNKAVNDLESLLHKVVKSAPRSFSENTAADAVFQHYYAFASERGIFMKINATLPDREFMSPDDLGLILSHSCENAIEACEGLKDSLIEINTYVHKNNFWFYSIRNSVKERVEIVDGEIFTTKEDKTSHGFGLPGIRSVVEKYGGVLAMDSDKHFFTLKISIKVPDKIHEEIR